MSFRNLTSIPKPNDNYVPTGRYAAVIVETFEEQAPSGFTYWAFTFMILDGPYAGKRIVDQLHCKDPNPDIQNEEYGRLQAICNATNMGKIGASSTELHGIPLEIEVITIGRTTLVKNYFELRARSVTNETFYTRRTQEFD